MYSQSNYGQLPFGADRIPAEEKETYYENLMRLVPEFVSGKKELHELYTAQGLETGYLRHMLEETADQCFIATATHGLDRWEKLFGRNISRNLTYEQRREILAAKLRGQGTATIQMIRDTAAAFSGGEVEVVEDNAHSRFIVRFIGMKGIPGNMQEFLTMLEEIRPAHLAFSLEYRYTVWNEILQDTWNHYDNMTWNDVRTLKEA